MGALYWIDCHEMHFWEPGVKGEDFLPSSLHTKPALDAAEDLAAALFPFLSCMYDVALGIMS